MKVLKWIAILGAVTWASSCAGRTFVGGIENPAQPEDPTMTTTDTVSDEATFAALAELPDDEPVVMLNLLEFAGDGGASYAKYGRVALPQIVKRGGKILYNGSPLRDDPIAGH